MTDETQSIILKALYAGYKYHLAIGQEMEAITTCQFDTPGNDALVSRYWEEWTQYTAEAIERRESEGENS